MSLVKPLGHGVTRKFLFSRPLLNLSNQGRLVRASANSRAENSGPRPFPISEITQLNFEETTHVRFLLENLYLLCPYHRSFGYQFRNAFEPFPDEKAGKILSDILATKAKVLEGVRDFVAAPLSSHRTVAQVAGKLVACKLLLIHFEKEGDAKSLDAVVKLNEGLFEDMKAGRLTGHSRDLFEGLLYLLADRAKKNQTIWEAIKAPIISNIQKGVYGIGGKVDELGDFTLIRVIEKLPERVSTDPDLRAAVLGLGRSPVPEVRCQSQLVVYHLGPTDSIPIFLDYIANPQNAWVFRSGVGQLSRFTAEELRLADIVGEKISQRLKGANSVFDVVERILEEGIELDDLLELTPNFINRLFGILLKSMPDGDQAKIKMAIEMAREKGLTDSKRDFISLLARGSMGPEYNPIIDLLKDWMMDEYAIAGALAKEQGHKFTPEKVRFFFNGSPHPSVVDFFAAGLGSDQLAIRVQCLNAMCDPKFRRFISDKHVNDIIRQLANEESSVGSGERRLSMADLAEHALVTLIKTDNAATKLLLNLTLAKLMEQSKTLVGQAKEENDRVVGRLIRVLKVNSS